MAISELNHHRRASALSEPLVPEAAAAAADDPEFEVVGFREFSATPEEVAEARHFAHRTLAARGASDEVVAAADLVVEEFALHAIRQTGTGFSVSVEVAPGVVRVAVRDDSNVFPQIGEAARTSIGGMGLSIIASTAEQWGAESLGRGKEVWAELR